jgi:hypothetical protein
MPAQVNKREAFDLQISDPVLLLNEIAKRYQSTPRILMEYVDNALDDAEGLYRDNGGTYPHDVRIDIHVDARFGKVAVKDNCRGMTTETLKRIVQNVGESQKRGCTWVNGRFGFGVHAFRAAAHTITFHTKHEFDEQVFLRFNREQHRGLRSPEIVNDEFPTDRGTGTLVTLSTVDPEWRGELEAELIKQEVELHFERLLARPRLSIWAQQDDGVPVRCEPFDYDAIPGQPFLRQLAIQDEGVTYPVEVHLKVCCLPVPDRTPRFFARGRRLNDVRNIRSFMGKSRHRTSVWGHDHLVGYIEVGEAVAPVITRDDFERSQRRTKLYQAILGLEEDLKTALDAINQEQRDRRLGRLEDLLRQVLSQIAREDALRFRSEVVGAGRDEPVTGQGGSTASEGSGGLSQQETIASGGHDGAGEGEGRGPAGEGQGPMPGTGAGGLPPEPNTVPEAQTAATRRRSGFEIKFMDLPPDAEGRLRRSRLLEGTIIINVGHEDFQGRLDHSRQGQARVTDRLINYLAGVISIHYKDQYYEKYRNQPDRRDQLFDEQVDFICRLEAALIPQIAQLQARMDADLTQGDGDGEEA